MDADSDTKTTQMRLTEAGVTVLGIVAVAGVVTLTAAMPGIAYAVAPFVKKNKHKKAKYDHTRYAQRNIDALVRQGLLKKSVDRKGIVRIRLTRKGEWETGIRGFFRRPTSRSKWDGVWHIVVFDVPERNRNLRRELRRGVELYGFRQLQKSVWVYPYECVEFIDLVKKHLGISQDVLYLKANYIENEKHLRKEFSL